MTATNLSNLNSMQTIRIGNDVCNEESQFLSLRQQHINSSWKAFLNDTSVDSSKDYPPIGIVLSGGGLRSCIASHAFCCALDEMNIWSKSSHISTLSGSTWFLTNLLYKNKPLSTLSELLQKSIGKTSSVQHIINAAKQYYPYAYQDNALCKQWGRTIGLMLIEEDIDSLEKITLSSLRANLDSAQHPYPLFSGIIFNERPYSWIEFSPDETGLYGQVDSQTTWIKTSNLYAPPKNKIEENITLMLGAFSSAHTAKPLDIYDRINDWFANPTISSQQLQSTYEKVKNWLAKFDNVHFPAAKVTNFIKTTNAARYSQDEYLEIADAGICCNLPLLPLLRRNRNSIYFICDVSATLQKNRFKGLEKAASLAKEQNLPFPHIDYSSLEINSCNIIYDDHPESPIIFYYPFSQPFATIKLYYTNQEFKTLFNTVKSVTLKSQEIIEPILKALITTKS